MILKKKKSLDFNKEWEKKDFLFINEVVGGGVFKTYQRGGNLSSLSSLIVKNAIKRQHGNHIGSNSLKKVGRRTFKALTGKTARSIVKNKVLPWVTNELNKRL